MKESLQGRMCFWMFLLCPSAALSKQVLISLNISQPLKLVLISSITAETEKRPACKTMSFLHVSSEAKLPRACSVKDGGPSN